MAVQVPSRVRRHLEVLEPDEEVTRAFHCFLGRWSMRGGLLFMTDRRLVYVSLRWFRRRVVSIAFEAIAQTKVVPLAHDQDVVIETTSGERFHFRNGIGGMEYFSSLFSALQKQLGERLQD